MECTLNGVSSGRSSIIDIDRKSDSYPPTMGEIARLVLELQAAGRPIMLSINGRGKLPVTDHQSIQQFFEFGDQLETLEALKEGVRYFEKGGKRHSLEDVCRELREKHVVPL